MSNSLSGLFVAAILFGLLGLFLGFDGIARLKRRAAPPFNTGLYTATWLITPPPEDLVLFWDSTAGKVILWASLAAAPIACGVLLFKRENTLAGLGPLAFWTTLTGLFGIWFWAFSLFVPKV